VIKNFWRSVGDFVPGESGPVTGLVVLCVALTANGQQASTAASVASSQPAPPVAKAQASGCNNQVRSTYLLGPDDQLQISGPELDDNTNKLVSVDGQGDVQVPLVGRVHVAGLTVQEAEQELNKRLSKYIRNPQVALDVKELRSQPASVLGQVNAPGIHQVSGHKTLLEMISMAGGTKADAGYRIQITREMEWGCIPLPGATIDPSGKYSVAAVSLQDIMEAKRPEENIQILPHDVVTVPKAELIYVTGAVKSRADSSSGNTRRCPCCRRYLSPKAWGPRLMQSTRESSERWEIKRRRYPST